jgi:CTP:phosphocholine cytidylyltransferase-like protein
VKKATPRADIPDSLKSYFKRNVFQEDMYRSTHPHMAYSINNTSEEVLLNCSQKSLATIIDNFGQDGQHIIGRTVITKSTKSKLPFPDGYTIKLLDADYNAVKHFCLHLQNDIYVIEPESLRKEIISEIRARLDTYSSIE